MIPDPSHNCPHSVTDIDEDTGEEYCIKCGDVVEPPEGTFDDDPAYMPGRF